MSAAFFMLFIYVVKNCKTLKSVHRLGCLLYKFQIQSLLLQSYKGLHRWKNKEFTHVNECFHIRHNLSVGLSSPTLIRV